MDQGAFLHALYALWCVCPEVNGELPENELWNEKLETWTQEMGKGVFKNSAGVLVGKTEYRMDGSGTYVWNDEDGQITKIVEYAADSEDVEDDYVGCLQRTVHGIKQNRRMEERYMLTELLMQDERRTGRCVGTFGQRDTFVSVCSED